MTRIIVNEYPKSGGSWLVSLLGDLLDLPKRDLYVQEGFQAFDIHKHPWYRDQTNLNVLMQCVVKSHELPLSNLQISGKPIHLLRDGRDVIVSKYIFEKDFCVKNGLYPSFDVGFEDYIVRTAKDWKTYIESWSTQEGVVTVKYEDLLEHPVMTLENLLNDLNESPVLSIEHAMMKNTKETMRNALGELFVYNTFVRKGVRGDWKNHFTDAHKILFNEIAGDMLLQLGYEKDSKWSM